MRGRPSHSLARSLFVTLALVVTACSSGSEQPQPRLTVATTAPAVPTTPPAPTIDLSKPIPGGSLHGTPRPPLENTGDDYVAITKSLIANVRWLTENPDPAVVSEIWVPGTELHDSRISSSQYLVDNSYRWGDEDYQLRVVEVVDVRPDIVAVRVTDWMRVERLVDSDGDDVGVKPRVPEEKIWNVLLAIDAEGRWRIAGWSPSGGGSVTL